MHAPKTTLRVFSRDTVRHQVCGHASALLDFGSEGMARSMTTASMVRLPCGSCLVALLCPSVRYWRTCRKSWDPSSSQVAIRALMRTPSKYPGARTLLLPGHISFSKHPAVRLTIGEAVQLIANGTVIGAVAEVGVELARMRVEESVVSAGHAQEAEDRRGPIWDPEATMTVTIVVSCFILNLASTGDTW